MNKNFHEIAHIIKKWPSLGQTAAHRVLNGLMGRSQTLSELTQLVSFFSQYTICSFCGAPRTTPDCFNCQMLKECAYIFIVPHFMDYVLLSEDCFRSHCGFILLQGYISPMAQQSPESIKLSRIPSVLSTLKNSHNRLKSIAVLFNQSLEARATLAIIKKTFSSYSFTDLSEHLSHKEAVFVLSSKELENYKMQILSQMPS